MRLVGLVVMMSSKMWDTSGTYIHNSSPHLVGQELLDRHSHGSSLQGLIQLRRVRGVAMTIALEIAVPSLAESSTIEYLGDQGKNSTILNGDNPLGIDEQEEVVR